MDDDRRRWARIEASLECTVAAADQTFDAKVVNVSRSGVAVLAAEGLMRGGEKVTVLLERGAASLGLSGAVVRIVRDGADSIYGVHFEALPPDSEEQLIALIAELAKGRGNGRREHPRVATHIAVSCKSVERFKALLSDLSRGGMAIRCPRHVAAGATLVVEFGVAGKADLLVLEGTVTHVEELPDGKNIAGLSFTPPSDDTRAKIQSLLELLLGLESDQ
jgi:c-di-GMP-binding flagellar brake protein YcgR